MRPFRIRTLTLGIELPGTMAPDSIDGRLDALARARDRFAEEGFEVQTVRLAAAPIVASMTPAERDAALPRLVALDRVLASRGTLLSLGPVLTADDEGGGGLAGWMSALNAATTAIHASVSMADGRVHRRALETAAAIVPALARAADRGLGNFRFAAAARVPAGTPFFPVAWHAGGPPSLAIGVEGAPLVEAAIERGGIAGAAERIGDALTDALAPVEVLAERVAADEGWRYGGIDPSPAPLGDRSIAGAIERLAGVPFGLPGTLAACTAVTRGVQAVRLRTCGYAGLMLPVLEDTVLATRAAEGRLRLQDLLLCSAVCGTGLDVVPLPGNTPPGVLAAILADVAAMAVRLGKPLAARLLPVPGLDAGDMTAFDDPYLVNTRVLNPGDPNRDRRDAGTAAFDAGGRIR